MIASSAFVLAALTMTGVYMNDRNDKAQDDGYTLDFEALDEAAEEMQEQIPGATEDDLQGNVGDGLAAIEPQVTEDDLDYMPLEAGSGKIEIPGLTDKPQSHWVGTENLEEAPPEEPVQEAAVLPETEPSEEAVLESAAKEDLYFAPEMGLLRPVSGEILIHYSMDSSVYFATLDQYKYNPAVFMSAPVDTPVSACAAGKVVSIFQDARIGKALTLDLGNGYQVTYGQLDEIHVSEGAFVDEGDVLGDVADPTIYFTVEGSNLYFDLKKEGEPVNPEAMFR